MAFFKVRAFGFFISDLYSGIECRTFEIFSEATSVLEGDGAVFADYITVTNYLTQAPGSTQ